MNSPITLKRIANLLGIALLIAVVAPFVVYAVPAVVGAEYSFVVLTASMTPAIAPGDVVVVDERDPATIAEGDVITYVRGDSETPVTHRVTGVETADGEFAFETQGDANEGPDSALVPAENVLGAVTVTIPYIGYVVQFTDSPIGFALLVVVPFGLLALSEVWSLYRSRTRGGDGSDGVDTPDVDPAAETNVETESTDANTDETATGSGFVVTNRTVEGAVAVLLFFVPYAAYVGYTLRTAVAVAVAVGTGMTLLMAVVLLVTAGDGDESSDAVSDPDDGGADVPVGGNNGVGGGPGDANVREDDRVDEPGGIDDGSPTGIFERPVIAPAADGRAGAVDEGLDIADEEGR